MLYSSTLSKEVDQKLEIQNDMLPDMVALYTSINVINKRPER